MGGGGDVKQAANYSPAEMQLFDVTANQIKKGLQSGETFVYPGETRAKTPDEFFGAIDAAKDFSTSVSDSYTQAINRFLSGDAAYDYNPVDVTNYWQDNFATPAMSTWKNEVMPMLESQYAGNMFNTRAGQAIGREASTFVGESLLQPLYNAQMTERMAGIQSKESAADRALQMTSMLPSAQAGVLSNNINIASLLQNERQAVINDDIQKWMRTSGAPSANEWLQAAMQYRGTANPTMDSFVTEGTDWAGIAGAGLAGYGALSGSAGIGGLGMAMLALSDERLKDNIRVAKIDGALSALKKLKPTLFHFINSPMEDEELGYIAQEVEEVIPEAIGSDPNGIRFIKYTVLIAYVIAAIVELSEGKDN